MLLSLEGYVNVLKEECEYITPFQQTSLLFIIFLFFFLSPLLPPPSSHFPLTVQTHSSPMKSLKVKSCSPRLESTLNIFGSGTLRLQSMSKGDKWHTLVSFIALSPISEKNNKNMISLDITRQHYTRLHVVNAREQDVPWGITSHTVQILLSFFHLLPGDSLTFSLLSLSLHCCLGAIGTAPLQQIIPFSWAMLPVFREGNPTFFGYSILLGCDQCSCLQKDRAELRELKDQSLLHSLLIKW